MYTRWLMHVGESLWKETSSRCVCVSPQWSQRASLPRRTSSSMPQWPLCPLRSPQLLCRTEAHFNHSNSKGPERSHPFPFPNLGLQPDTQHRRPPPPNVRVSAPETWRTQDKGTFQPHLMPYCKDRRLGVWRGCLMIRIYHGLLLGKDICGRLSWGGVGYGGRHKKKKEKIGKKIGKAFHSPPILEYPVKQKSAILLLFASSTYLLTSHRFLKKY